MHRNIRVVKPFQEQYYLAFPLGYVVNLLAGWGVNEINLLRELDEMDEIDYFGTFTAEQAEKMELREVTDSAGVEIPDEGKGRMQISKKFINGFL